MASLAAPAETLGSLDEEIDDKRGALRYQVKKGA